MRGYVGNGWWDVVVLIIKGVIMVEVVLVIVGCWFEECRDNGGCLMMM